MYLRPKYSRSHALQLNVRAIQAKKNVYFRHHTQSISAAMTTSKLTLDDLRALPLDKVLISAVVCPLIANPDLDLSPPQQRLGAVGGLANKLEVAGAMKNRITLVALSKDQNVSIDPIPDDCDKWGFDRNRPIIQAGDLADLAQQISNHFGPRRFGQALDLPNDLRAERDIHSPYHPKQHLQRAWIHKRISNFVDDQSAESTEGGYILLTAGATWGKTAFSLDWMRASSNTSKPPEHFCPLAGWTFIRQAAGGRHENPADILLGLEHRTRMQLNMPFADETKERDFPKNPDANLNAHFKTFLADCATYCATKNTNIVLLIDGVDELFGPMGSHPTVTLPTALPGELGKGVHIALTSRPGQHLIWGDDQPRRLCVLDMDSDSDATTALASQKKAALRNDALRMIRRVAKEWNEAGDHASAAILVWPSDLGEPDDHDNYSGQSTDRSESDGDGDREKSSDEDHGEDSGRRQTTFTRHLLNASQLNLHYIRTLLDEAGLKQEDDYQQNTPRRPDHKNRNAQLLDWQQHPESLPTGISELLALIFARLWLRNKPLNLKQRKRAITAIAMAACLRSAEFSIDDLARLFFQGDGQLFGNASVSLPDTDSMTDRHAVPDNALLVTREDFIDALHLGRPCWTAPRGEQPDHKITMQFRYLLLRDCAIAAYEVLADRNWEVTRSLQSDEMALARDIAQAVKESHQAALQFDHAARQGTRAWLHQALGLASSRFWRAAHSTQTKPEVRVGDKPGAIKSYAYSWGLWHALNGGERHPALGQRALALLLDAAHLQSAIRAAPDQAFDALRESYVLADVMGTYIEKGDPSQTLRIRVEASLMQWEEQLKSDIGLLAVGACLHNLLGRWDEAKNFASSWRNSIDIPALLANPPGVPSAFLRRLDGFVKCSLSPCGQWIVGKSFSNDFALWDMRQGWHRPKRISQLWPGTYYHACIQVDGKVVIAAAEGGDIGLDVCDPDIGQVTRHRIEGRTKNITSIALRVQDTGQGIMILVASGSYEGTIGLLALSFKKIINQSEHTKLDPDWLHYFSGHEAAIPTIALRTETTEKGTTLLVASGSYDGTIGLLAQSLEKIGNKAKDANPDPVWLHRFAGHTGIITSIALRTGVTEQGTLLLVASGSGDGTIGLLAQPLENIMIQPVGTMPIPDWLHRFGGHTDGVGPIVLRTKHTEQGIFLLVASSGDYTIGLLVQPLKKISTKPASPEPEPNLLYRFAGHTNWINSIALRTEDTEQGTMLIAASGSSDETIGLLVQPLEKISIKPIDMQPDWECLHRFRVNRDEIHSIALCTKTTESGTMLLLANGSNDRTISLMSQPLEKIICKAADATPIPDWLRRFDGHKSAVTSIAVRTEDTEQGAMLLVASGSSEGAIGLLSLPLEDVCNKRADAEPIQNYLHCFDGHADAVRAIALCIDVTNQGTILLVASGSGEWRSTIGLLAQPLEKINNKPAHADPIPNCLHLFDGYSLHVHSITLHTEETEQGTMLLVTSEHLGKTAGTLEQPMSAIYQQPASQDPMPDIIQVALSTGDQSSLIPWPLNKSKENHTVVIGIQSIAVGFTMPEQTWTPTLICPVSTDGITWHAMTRASDNEVVVAGAQGNDIVLLLLELINGDIIPAS